DHFSLELPGILVRREGEHPRKRRDQGMIRDVGMHNGYHEFLPRESVPQLLLDARIRFRSDDRQNAVRAINGVLHAARGSLFPRWKRKPSTRYVHLNAVRSRQGLQPPGQRLLGRIEAVT